ncbi:acyl-CoA synthetase (AMP-forming)/AMP-acid ligase II [Nocardiopsis sp. Huas11]|uniref:fatty acyl-AMP ligase n=1 Tax=Nocardiopsis sp. Huas11 TaxID=2183912 RepID=UPI000EAFB7FB|nr:fatty acyl-AMP ligase [Nocardiopsis sp. Huas11]RKS10371.1 acyl-CoA synthetase (AMP-forming)/AMP-acid ligase II [Nocardiopsis sp. Huas11]
MTTVMSPPTLIDRLHAHAEQRPDARACVFVKGEAETDRSLTYRELDTTVRAVAAALRTRLAPGDRVLLLLPEGPDFVPAFLGCLRAGVIAVPAYPPQSAREKHRMGTLRAIFADCRPAAVLTSLPEEARADLRAAAPETEGAWWADVDDLVRTPVGPTLEQPTDPAMPAFLQYTSGSTSLPKGVVVTHGALAHNLEMIRAAFERHEDLRWASWLPLFHDMGLIGNVLAPLWAGGLSVVMAPFAFIKRPARWLWMISRYGANISGGPNFAYDLCTSRVRDQEIEGLDLSGWKSAFNGAEPIRSGSLARFAERFAPYGFTPSSWWPCYGLAEATLLVTANRVGTVPTELTVDTDELQAGRAVPAPTGRTLVTSGFTSMDRTVAIVDPETARPLPDGVVGEVWIGGPDLPTDYWENPEASERTFAARTATGTGGAYLRSGDLGFVHEGELFVTGRLKDVVIVGGRNHYPQDLEATVEEAHPAVGKNYVIAFSVEQGDHESVVLVAGVGGGLIGQGDRAAAKREEIAQVVRAAVAVEHGIQVDDVVLVGRTQIPKTSSGKVQRGVCRNAYLAGEYAPVGATTQEETR